MKKRSIQIIGATVILLLVAAGVYVFLGGTAETKVALVSCNSIDLVGLEFRGIPQDERLGQYFQEVEANRGKAPLYTIYYEEPLGKRDTLHVFVGLGVEDGPEPVPDSWIQRSFACNEAVRASLRMHQWVMPGPQQTKERMRAFALSKGQQLQGLFIDKIIGRDHVEVWAPIRE